MVGLTRKFLVILLALALTSAANVPFVWRKVENTAFQSGEVLKYRLHYGVINAGVMTTKIEDGELFNDRPCYHATLEGETNSAIAWAYKVRDKFESWIDKESLAPVKYYKSVRENKYEDKDLAIYQPDKSQMTTSDGKITAAAYTQDIGSVMFYLRTVDLATAKAGTNYAVSIYLDKKIYNLGFTYLGKETIKSDVGKVKCYKIRPKLVVDRVFKNTNGMTMWVSEDENKIPIRIQSEIRVGSVKADLISYSGLRNAFTAKTK